MFRMSSAAFDKSAGAMIGIVQIVSGAGASSELVWIVVGFFNSASGQPIGLPIYLSFKKGIFHGVK